MGELARFSWNEHSGLPRFWVDGVKTLRVVERCKTCIYWRTAGAPAVGCPLASCNEALSATFGCRRHKPNRRRRTERRILAGVRYAAYLAVAGLVLLSVYADRQLNGVIQEDVEFARSGDDERVEAIKKLTTDPLQQLALVEISMSEGVQHYGTFEMDRPNRWFVPRLHDILEDQEKHAWIRPRSDCKGQAVWAAHLLNGLGFKYRARTSLALSHAWIEVEHDGKLYDLNGVTPAEGETWLACLWEPMVRLHIVRRLCPLSQTDGTKQLCDEIRNVWREPLHTREAELLGFKYEGHSAAQ